MAYYVDLVNGNDYFNGSQFAQPSVDEYLILFAGTCGSTSYTVTPPTGYTERLDTADADTGLTSFFADWPTYKSTTLGNTDATISATTAVKAASLIALKSQGTTPIAVVNTAVTGEADQSVDAAAPASIADNDVMIAMVWAGCTSGSAAVITAPAGWELICTVTVGSYTRMGIYWKRCSSESGTYTFSHNNANTPKTQVAIIAYRNCITTGNPYDSYSNTQYTTSNATLRAATITPTAVDGPKLTISSITAAMLTPGDTIKIAKTASALLGNATWTNKNTTVTLADANKTKVIDLCETNWTALTGTSVAVNTARYVIEGTYSERFQAASAFTTGLMAYKAFDATDFSDYTKISFAFRASADLAASTLKVCLCSDNAGATPVNSFTITDAYESTAGWYYYTFDNVTALGDSIQSIALYALIDPATTNIYLDDIIACNGLSLNSVIGLNIAGESWYAIKSINDTAIVLSGAGYYGDNAGAGKATYYINPVKFSNSPAAASGDSIITVPEGGSSSAGYNTYEGGYNTSTGLVDGITFLDGINLYGRGFDCNQINFMHFKNLGIVRTAYAFYADGFNINATNCYSAYNSYGFTPTNGANYILEDCDFCCNAYGIYGSTSQDYNLVAKDTKAHGCSVSGATLLQMGKFINCEFNYNTEFGFGEHDINSHVYNVYFYNCELADNTLGAITLGASYSTVFAKNTDFNGGIEFVNAPLQSYKGKIISIDDVQFGGHKIYMADGTITEETTTRHTESGIAWKISPTDNTYMDENSPITQLLATIAVDPGATPETITITCYVYRSNAAINAKLYCMGGQLAGITSDVSETAHGSASTWEQLSIDVVPTEEGTFEVELHVWGGTTYNVIVDDVAITVS